MSRALSASALSLLLLAPATAAGEFYVDVAHGSDANSGTSPAAAWKTLTHALGTAVDLGDFIHVAPGDYSPATGEVFPLPLGPAYLHGDQGPAVTRIIGTGPETLLQGEVSGSVNSFGLQGLSLLNAATGVSLRSTDDAAFLQLVDVVMVDMSDIGVDLVAEAGPGLVTPPSVQLIANQVDIADSGTGMRVSSTSVDFISQLCLTNSSVSHGSGDGLVLDSVAGGKIFLSLGQSRLVGNGGAGVRANVSGFMELGVGTCLIADNATGIDVQNDGGELHASLFYCTLAGHEGSALNVEPGMPAVADVQGSIFWGNAADVSGSVVLQALDSDSEHGAFGAADGNVSVDPLFRGAAQGDYRLSFGSPCIDAGAEFAMVDVDGVMRPADGDLDTVQLLDLGAIEFQPLVVETTGELGTQVLFENYGMPCMITTLFVAPGDPLPAKATKFGALRLSPVGILPLFVTIVLAPAPNLVVATIPVEPALVGLTFSFQGLTSSLVAPKNFALTDVQSLVILE